MNQRRIWIGLLAVCFAMIYLGSIYWLAARKSIHNRIVVNVTPHHADWVYHLGDTVKFIVTVKSNRVLFKNIEINYAYGPEMMPPVKNGKQQIKNGQTVIDAGTMTEAGFLRCHVYVSHKGKNYKGTATAAFSPETIQPTTTMPDDFTQFWDNALSELASIPLDAQFSLLPERCTDKVNVYHVNFQNIQRYSVYGILCVPNVPGSYPAILILPHGGVPPIHGDVTHAEKGVITLEIGIHGIPANMNSKVYSEMEKGSLFEYWKFNLDDKDRYYYKRVYTSCVRAVDFIFSLPDFDGANMIAYGESQGGALAIVTAALDSRIKGLVSFYPALCDMTGYLNGRAGGGLPVLNEPEHISPAKIETSRYYDVVNFARQMKIPGFYTWGFNDELCPPTSMYAAYNVIQAPRTLYVVKENGHWFNSEQSEKATEWIFNMFK